MRRSTEVERKFKPARSLMKDNANIHDTVRLPGHGRFSAGMEQLPDTPAKQRIGRFSEGIEQRQHDERRTGRFSDGIEQLPHAASGLRRGSFAEGYGRGRTAAPGDSASDGSPSPWPHSREEAEVEHLMRALRGYGVLTRAHLLDVCGAAHWPDSGFKRALAQAVSSGRIRHLGDDLYEIADPAIARRGEDGR
jgi:hypothetical protein